MERGRYRTSQKCSNPSAGMAAGLPRHGPPKTRAGNRFVNSPAFVGTARAIHSPASNRARPNPTRMTAPSAHLEGSDWDRLQIPRRPVLASPTRARRLRRAPTNWQKMRRNRPRKSGRMRPKEQQPIEAHSSSLQIAQSIVRVGASVNGRLHRCFDCHFSRLEKTPVLP